MLKLTGVHWAQIIFSAQSLNADGACRSIVHPLLEKGHIQSLAVLAHDSGEICSGFFHAVIKTNSSGQIKMGFNAVMKKNQLFGRKGDM